MFVLIKAIAEAANERMLAGKKTEDGDDPGAMLPQGRGPRSRDIIGQKIGMGGKTYHTIKATRQYGYTDIQHGSILLQQ